MSIQTCICIFVCVELYCYTINTCAQTHICTSQCMYSGFQRVCLKQILTFKGRIFEVHWVFPRNLGSEILRLRTLSLRIDGARNLQRPHPARAPTARRFDTDTLNVMCSFSPDDSQILCSGPASRSASRIYIYIYIYIYSSLYNYSYLLMFICILIVIVKFIFVYLSAYAFRPWQSRAHSRTPKSRGKSLEVWELTGANPDFWGENPTRQGSPRFTRPQPAMPTNYRRASASTARAPPRRSARAPPHTAARMRAAQLPIIHRLVYTTVMSSISHNETSKVCKVQ